METINYDFTKYKNFDFKNKWRDEIKPHLNNDKVIKSIERGILGYIHNKKPLDDNILFEITSFDEYFGTAQRHKYVADYLSNDSFVIYTDELKEQVIQENNLNIDELFLIKYPQYNGKDDEELEDDDDYFQLSYDFREEILEPYLDEILKDDYKTYCLYGGCFFYNLTFGYTLAKLVYPNYKWEIASSSKHLTVVCHEHKLIFDILHYDEDTPDFGALRALNDAFCDNEIDFRDIICQYIFLIF